METAEHFLKPPAPVANVESEQAPEALFATIGFIVDALLLHAAPLSPEPQGEPESSNQRANREPALIRTGTDL